MQKSATGEEIMAKIELIQKDNERTIEELRKKGNINV
jgi:hypothetical protein